MNETDDNLIIRTLAAYTNIPGQFFTPDLFTSSSAIAQGQQAASFPSSLVLAPGIEIPALDLGPLLLGNYDLVTGIASRASDPSATFPFAFAAQAVPEPLSIALFASSLIGLALVRRRLSSRKHTRANSSHIDCSPQ